MTTASSASFNKPLSKNQGIGFEMVNDWMQPDAR